MCSKMKPWRNIRETVQENTPKGIVEEIWIQY